MCRFLLLKSTVDIDPQLTIENFSEMARKSESTDGDWQGDGWGISWLNKNHNWSIYKSLLPIWSDNFSFSQIPKTKFLVIHARCASFPDNKNNINYNQPYIDNNYAFVFNGFLKGVKIPFDLKGKIGAQKIWFLLKNFLANGSPENAILKLKELLTKNTKKIQALNIGLCNKKNIYAFCMYEKYPEYYQLNYHQSKNLLIVASEAIKGYDFNSLKNGKIIKF